LLPSSRHLEPQYWFTSLQLFNFIPVAVWTHAMQVPVVVASGEACAALCAATAGCVGFAYAQNWTDWRGGCIINNGSGESRCLLCGACSLGMSVGHVDWACRLRRSTVASRGSRAGVVGPSAAYDYYARNTPCSDLSCSLCFGATRCDCSR
jgi:hypothetical protein